MRPTLEPWWRQELRGHPLAAVLAAGPRHRWEPTPVPAVRVHDAPHAFSVTWALDLDARDELEVEVVGEHLVLRTVRGGQVVSRAIPLPPDVDLGRRRDHWTGEAMEVVVPRIRPTWLGRLRHALARFLRGVAGFVAPE